jgi:hypothetical protein
MKTLTFYLIPPILSLLVSLILSGIAIRTKPRTTELKLFSIVCLWWGLLSPVFISHHFLNSISQILAIERFIHFFYVFLPALNIVFVHHLLGIRNKPVVLCAFLLSGLLATTTPTNLYIHGLYQYDGVYRQRWSGFSSLWRLLHCNACLYCFTNGATRKKGEQSRPEPETNVYHFLLLLVRFFDKPKYSGNEWI